MYGLVDTDITIVTGHYPVTAPPTEPTVRFGRDGKVYVETGDEDGSYIVHAGTLYIPVVLTSDAERLGWHVIGPQMPQESERGLVKIHRTFGEATEQYVKAYGLPHRSGYSPGA